MTRSTQLRRLEAALRTTPDRHGTRQPKRELERLNPSLEHGYRVVLFADNV